MSDGLTLGLIVDGVNIREKWGIKVKDRKYIKPNKKKMLEYLPHTSEVSDFSEIYGGTPYEERTIQYTLNLIGSKPSRVAAEFLDTEFTNFIMQKKQFKLIDELFKDYYFLAEVREGTDFSPLFHLGELTVTFTAYPFRIKIAKEGSPFWDDYSILDYYQKTSFEVERKPFELLSIGTQATLGCWATRYGGGVTIPITSLGTSYKILEVKDFVTSISKRSYKLEGLTEWVIEQDIIQTQKTADTFTLNNTGAGNNFPAVSSDQKCSILMNGYVFNIWKDVPLSDLFTLKPGINNFKIYLKNPTTVDINFHKELI